MKNAVLRIGVSGHQSLGDEETERFVAQSIREQLLAYRQKASDIVLYASLALGADRLFVKTALDLGISVEIVIPCSTYEDLFLSTRDEYNNLLRSSQRVHYLPLRDCSDDAFLAAGRWIVDHSDIVLLAWNGLPARGRGGTADIASYARAVKCPFIHINTRLRTIKAYGDASSRSLPLVHAPMRAFATTEQVVYQGKGITVKQYEMTMPDGEKVVRDVAEYPESVRILPIGEPQILLLIEEYDFGAGAWQVKLPGGKVENTTQEGIYVQAQQELRQEIGYKAAKLEKLVDCYRLPGYVSSKMHLLVGYGLEWDPLEIESHEEIRVQTYSLQEALALTSEDYRCEPETALALWLYAHKLGAN
jgi:8-oxo-dGTP pyrophosphatase MutT (NUDIX family)